MNKIKELPLVRKVGLNRVILLGVLLLMYAAFSVMSPTFLSYSRILSALNYAYFLGFLALGVTFVIATGGIDFSVGPVMFCAALISGQLLTKAGVPLALCLLIAILVGFLFGAFNGVLVAYAGVPPFITSMAGMMIAKGVGSVATKTQSISWPQIADASGWYRNLIKINIGSFTFPVGLVILLAVAAVCAVVLNKTLAGRYILCLGSNKEAVRLSGINVDAWKVGVYTLSGFFVGIAGLMYAAAYTTITPGTGNGQEMNGITGVVIGGTSMSGGSGSMAGTLIGVFIMSVLKNGLSACGLQAPWQTFFTGLVVIGAVLLDIQRTKAANRVKKS